MGRKPAAHAYEPSADEVSRYAPGETTWCERPDGEALIRYAKSGFASEAECPAVTLFNVMEIAAKRRGASVALVQEPPEAVRLAGAGADKKAPPALPLERWRKWTFAQYRDDARTAAKAMIELGHAQHDTVSVWGFNSPEWAISAAGAWYAGGKASGIYPTDTIPQVKYKLFHSRTSVVCVETEEHLASVAKIAQELPLLKAVVVWGETPSQTAIEGGSGVSGVRVLSWSGFLELGKSVPEARLDERMALVRPGHACSIIYTSGTTGEPKAVMVTHDNFAYTSRVCMTQGTPGIAESASDVESIVSYLPLSHVAGQMVDIVTPLVVTAFRPGIMQVWFARPYDLKIGTLVDRLRAARPSCFLGVPRVYEKIAERLQAIGAQNTGLKKQVASWAKARGIEYAKNSQLGGTGSKPTTYDLYDRLVFHKIKERLGLDRMRFAYSGAAPINTSTVMYFASIGIQVGDLWGLSESTGAGTWSQQKVWGSIGHALAGMEVKVLKPSQPGAKPAMYEAPRTSVPLDQNNFPDDVQGELCMRGRHIMMGYMANPDMGDEHVAEIRAKNAEAIDADGWLHTGDMGVKDERGMFKITGRFKELIIGSGGENIAPVPIEQDLKRQSGGVVSNVQMIGDKRKYNVALITLTAKGATGEKPGGDALDGPALGVAQGVTTVSAAAKSPEFIKFLEKCVKATNNNGEVCPSQASRIAKFTILPHDFSVETGELTATLKLRRKVAEEANRVAVDALYDDANAGPFVKNPAMA